VSGPTDPPEIAPDDDPRSGQSSPDDTAEPDGTAAVLAREVYWATDPDPRSPGDLSSIRDRLDDFAHRLRVEQRQLVPIGETLLGSAAGWKRSIKVAVWRLTRFSTMRYDRLLADLAELTADLAARLHDQEEEIARLRAEVERREGP
jgi:hypothetical protein